MTDEHVVSRIEAAILNSFPAGTRIAQSHADERAFVVAWHTSPTKYGNIILPRETLAAPGAFGGPAGVLERFEQHTEKLGRQLSIQIA